MELASLGGIIQDLDDKAHYPKWPAHYGEPEKEMDLV